MMNKNQWGAWILLNVVAIILGVLIAFVIVYNTGCSTPRMGGGGGEVVPLNGESRQDSILHKSHLRASATITPADFTGTQYYLFNLFDVPVASGGVDGHAAVEAGRWVSSDHVLRSHPMTPTKWESTLAVSAARPSKLVSSPARSHWYLSLYADSTLHGFYQPPPQGFVVVRFRQGWGFSIEQVHADSVWAITARNRIRKGWRGNGRESIEQWRRDNE